MNGSAIVGVVTVASCSIEAADLPRHLRMKLVFMLARRQARQTGCAFVVVDAKPGAASYYERWGFERLIVEAGELDAKPTPTLMGLELGAIPDTAGLLPDE